MISRHLYFVTILGSYQEAKQDFCPCWEHSALSLTSTPCLSNCCVQHCRFINYRAGQAGPGPAASASFLIKLTSNAPNTTQQLLCCSRGTGTTEYWILNTNTHLGPAILIIICKVGVGYSEPVLRSIASIPLLSVLWKSQCQGVKVSGCQEKVYCSCSAQVHV